MTDASAATPPVDPRVRARRVLRSLSITALAIVLVTLGVLAWFLMVYPRQPARAKTDPFTIDITREVTLDELAAKLEEKGIIDSARIWTLFMHMRGVDNRLRRGVVTFAPNLTPEAVARHAALGLGRIRIRVTVPEGFNRYEIGARLEHFGVCDADDFVDATEEADVLEKLKIKAPSAEGYLFPDTYEFIDRMAAEEVVGKMVRNFRRRVHEVRKKHQARWTASRKALGWKLHDAVVLASIVEKEAAVASERRRIAGVFMNRLRSKSFLPRGRLQADPTVQYGCLVAPRRAKSCRRYKGKITKAMLEDADNSYNTYRHSGLPPGPIANPGVAAIAAVMNYEKHNYFYFVAKGGGRHAFSATLRGHNNAVNKYIRAGDE